MTHTPPKTGLLGGTFDPVHNAHLTIAARAREAAGLDRVLLLPAAVPPHKRGQHLTDGAHRLAMARLAAAELPWMGVCDWELTHPGRGYTVDTLKALRAAGEEQLCFIIGGDSLLMLDQWRDPAGLLAQAAFVAVTRPGCDEAALLAQRDRLLARFGGEIILVTGEGLDLSSTAIRARAAAGLPLDGLVPPAVAHYINEHQLYREDV